MGAGNDPAPGVLFKFDKFLLIFTLKIRFSLEPLLNLSTAQIQKVNILQSTFDLSARKSTFPLVYDPGIIYLFGQSGASQAGEETTAKTEDGVEETPALRKVLLVEDNLINQKVALRILMNAGYTADSANNGKEALIAFEKTMYDVVLMDIQMPIMDGIFATRSIREIYGPDAPYIIAVTANVTDEDRRNCFEAGMNDFVTKPIRSELLLAAIEKAPPARPVAKESKKQSISEC